MADNNPNKLGDITRTSLDSIRSMLDANTIIGDPITTPSGTSIIPISKISVGYASGGIDYSKKDAGARPNNFGGGGGTGLSVVPVAFLVVSPDGNVQILNINAPTAGTPGPAAAAPADTVSQVVGFLERSPELLERIKGIFQKKNQENKI